ncbi:hypothetical protein B9G54_00515 [Alloscardovia macacae]|uniref:DUF421 domain-containing protein n=1 Tax=Alloscardovia macacae TaxID=1160091 RepID=A0A1Y2T0X2_9BIFI|nr:DUF421 domain-containing protein [Alloscardovia macacae]OTA27592.1 hypothetical protein B9G54_00515 [Alloscardovia macacae]OTA30238.1 hypothetical protein B9T39_00595 [Alloscardovia macacae]
MTGMTLVAVKLLVGFIGLIIVINVTGKGNLAPKSASDQIQNYVLGALIGGVIYNDDIHVEAFIIILAIWLALVLGLRVLKRRSVIVKHLVDGRALTVIRDGKIDIRNCRRAGLSANELSFRLRAEKIYSVLDVRRVIVEQNGEFIIVRRGEQTPRFPVITDGQIHHDILDIIGRDEQWLRAELKTQGFKRPGQVFLAEYESGELFCVGYSTQEDAQENALRAFMRRGRRG